MYSELDTQRSPNRDLYCITGDMSGWYFYSTCLQGKLRIIYLGDIPGHVLKHILQIMNQTRRVMGIITRERLGRLGDQGSFI